MADDQLAGVPRQATAIKPVEQVEVPRPLDTRQNSPWLDNPAGRCRGCALRPAAPAWPPGPSARIACFPPYRLQPVARVPLCCAVAPRWMSLFLTAAPPYPCLLY